MSGRSSDFGEDMNRSGDFGEDMSDNRRNRGGDIIKAGLPPAFSFLQTKEKASGNPEALVTRTGIANLSVYRECLISRKLR